VSKDRPPPEPIGKVLRRRDADLRSAWGDNYARAIDEAAITGDVARLVDLLRLYRPLTDANFDKLADYVEATAATAKRGRGRKRNEPVHAAAQIAEGIMSVLADGSGRVSARTRTFAIEIGCRQIEREREVPVDAEQVRDLLDRPKRRRRPRPP
jgi:hypothetical protein